MTKSFGVFCACAVTTVPQTRAASTRTPIRYDLNSLFMTSLSLPGEFYRLRGETINLWTDTANILFPFHQTLKKKETRGRGRRRQKEKGKSKKLGEANLLIKSGFILTFAFYLLPFYFLLSPRLLFIVLQIPARCQRPLQRRER